MDRKEEMRKKLRAKLDKKNSESNNLNSNEEILENVKAMINDCQLPYIRRLNIRQKYNALEKKYKVLREKYIPIFRSILNEELTMDNIGMLEMMLEMKDKVEDDKMNNFLAEKYKLDKEQESKNDKINLENANKELQDYLKNQKKD
jgi:hypothetical protein